MNDLITLDQQLLLLLNGSDSNYWDGIWMAITTVGTWVAFYLSLLHLFARSYERKQLLIIILAFGLAILLADQVASGFCKPFFHRFRPTHEPALAGLVDVVDNYRGGLYGFMSSHAANGFAIATLAALIVRHRAFTFAMYLYAALTSYSRIYLGVHYPGDVLCGAIWGTIAALIVHQAYHIAIRRLYPTRRFFSKAYTPTGIMKEDAAIPITILLYTLLAIFFYAIYYALNH